MSERFAIRWVICCGVFYLACFILGFDAIPRVLGYDTGTGAILGFAAGVVLVWPFVWLAVSPPE